MKKSKGLFRLLTLFVLTLTPNLNAAITARFITSPGNALAPKNARVEFLTFEISSDTTEPLSSVRVGTTGSLIDKLRRVSILNAYGDEVGYYEPQGPGEKDVFVIPLSDTVNKANWSQQFTLVAETAYSLTPYAGQQLSLTVEGLWTRTGETSVSAGGIFPFRGATYTLNDSLTIGSLSEPQRLYKQANAVVGNNQIIGAFAVPVGSAEDVSVSSLPFAIHASGDARSITSVTLLD